MATSRTRDTVVGFMTGLAAGGVGTWLIAGLVSYAVIKFEEQRLQQGWELVPVVVASRGLSPGDKVTHDAMAQHPIPEQLVTSSLVKPDSATYVMNQVLIVPLGEGDPFHWAFFSTAGPVSGPAPASPGDPAVWEACDAALAASTAASRRERTPAEIRTRLVSEVRP